LATDELLLRVGRILDEMVIDREAIARNMAAYGPFAATERVLMAAVAAGANRQEAHEWIREASMQAWAAIRRGEANPLVALLQADEDLGRFLPPEQIRGLMQATDHTGTASARALSFAQTVRIFVGQAAFKRG